MLHPKLLVPAFMVAFSAACWFPACVPGQAGVASSTSTAPPACELTALALRFAEEEKAHAAFWMRVAHALNGPSSSLLAEANAAWSDHQDAMELAMDRYDARLASCALYGHGPYDPVIVPSAFSANVTNPNFLLVPGRTLVYERTLAGHFERKEIVTLSTTRVIDGVTCRPVQTTSTRDGERVELSTEWFAQHLNGTVWCFGENQLHFEEGLIVSVDGSWRAGRDGAKAGVAMPGSPVLNEICRSVYDGDDDEDFITVVSTNTTAVTANGTYPNCIVIEEWSPLEPGERDQKYFAPGIGLVLEIELVSGERWELGQAVNN